MPRNDCAYKSTLITVRCSGREWGSLKNIEAETGLKCHRLIKLAIGEALHSGKLKQLAHQYAQSKSKTPA